MSNTSAASDVILSRAEFEALVFALEGPDRDELSPEGDRLSDHDRALRTRIEELEAALREIADASPNWMEPDAVTKLQLRLQSIARAALTGSESDG